MAQVERRKHNRASSLNLLSYHCIDEREEIVMQGIGRTLNISEGGVLLETHVPINPEYFVSLFIALEDDLVDVKGRVIHSSGNGDGKFNTGIEFIGTNSAARQIITKAVNAFQKGQ